jgi:predicted Fe-Mo cluster-binding NifX family protein
MSKKVATPLFQDRVSPHFGSSSRVLLIELCDGRIVQEAVLDLGERAPLKLAARLIDLGVKTIICGGIPTPCKEWLEDKGAVVVDNQRGPARELIEKYRRETFRCHTDSK